MGFPAGCLRAILKIQIKMTFNPGDRVQLLDEALEGRVVEALGPVVRIRTQDGFIMDVAATSLVRMPDRQALDMNIPAGLDKFEDAKPGPTRRKGKKGRQGPVMQVDLHLEKLVPDPQSLPAFDALNLQVDTARGQLEFAIRKRIQRIVFIHGVGEGVLKAELETLFRRYEGLRYTDADYREFGQGATEVYLPQELFS